MGAVMAAAGFSWCYLIFVALTAHHFDWIDAHQMGICLQAGYVVLVPLILFAGYAITLESWVEAWRRRDLLSMGVAGWNTFASIHNTFSAIQNFGDAWRNTVGYFVGESEDNDDWLFVVGIVLGSIIGGVLTTMVIIYKTAANTPLPPYCHEDDQNG
jgi:hypothetical protein